MIATTHPRSVLEEALGVFDRWGSQIVLYLTVFVLSVGSALLLDAKFGVSPGRVLAYLLPLSAVLLIVLPIIAAAVRRLFFSNTVEDTLARAEQSAFYTLVNSLHMADALLGRHTGVPSNAILEKCIERFKEFDNLTALEKNLDDIQKEMDQRLDMTLRQATEVVFWMNQRTILKIAMAQRSVAQGDVSPDVKIALSAILTSLQRVKLEQYEKAQQMYQNKGAFDVYTEAYTRGADKVALEVLDNIARFFPETVDPSSSFSLKDFMEEQSRTGNRPLP